MDSDSLQPIPQKFCKKCETWKPATPIYFYKQPKNKDGLQGACKACSNAINARNLKARGTEKRRQWERRHYQTHRRDYFKQRYQQKRKQILVRQHMFWIENPEIVRTWKHRYARSARGLEIKRIKENRRRASKESVLGAHTPEQIQDQFKRQKHKCYYCHKRFKKSKGKYIYHIEHTYPLSRVAGSNIPANDIAYIVLACPSCNTSKGDKFPWEWGKGGRLL